MGKSARAIIIEEGHILIMHRDKFGSKYATLPGGRLDEGESPEAAIVREIREETGLEVVSAQLVFTEDNPAPYNFQYIFLCQVAPHQEVEVQASSEEGRMNRVGLDKHTPEWVDLSAFHALAFRTPTLQQAIVDALKHGFPVEPRQL